MPFDRLLVAFGRAGGGEKFVEVRAVVAVGARRVERVAGVPQLVSNRAWPAFRCAGTFSAPVFASPLPRKASHGDDPREDEDEDARR